MADPGWAARPPEANDLLLKTGTGAPAMLTNGAAWTALGAAHHGSGIASAANTAVTCAGWLGAGSAGSAGNATMLNAALHGLAGWVDTKAPVVAAAVDAYQLACGAMRTAQECEANRIETAADYGINPSVFFTLTPRIAALEYEYYGVFWPNNAAVGGGYGATLSALAAELAVPAPPAGMGASPAAPAAAAAAVGDAAAGAGASDAMRAAHAGIAGTAGVTGAVSRSAPGLGELGSMLGPVQQLGSSVLSAPQALPQPAQAAVGPMQSMLGMFAGSGVLGGAVEAGSPGAAPGVPGVSAAAGPPAGVGGGAPMSAFTRPVSAFESVGGRPV
ncbi:PPE domain-containing protein, partial [Mycobacterium sp. M1]